MAPSKEEFADHMDRESDLKWLYKGTCMEDLDPFQRQLVRYGMHVDRPHQISSPESLIADRRHHVFLLGREAK